MHNFKRSLLINLIIILVSVLMAAGGIFYIVSLINKDLTKILDFKNGVRRAREDVLSLTVLRREAGESAAAFQELRKALPARDDLFVFKKNVETLAANRKLKLGFSFGVESEPKDNLPGSVIFNLSVEGRFPEVVSFIQDMEKGSYLVEFSQMNITGDGDWFSGRVDGKVFFTK